MTNLAIDLDLSNLKIVGERRASGDQPTLGVSQTHPDSVGPGHWNDVRVRVHGHLGAHVRVHFSDL